MITYRISECKTVHLITSKKVKRCLRNGIVHNSIELISL